MKELINKSITSPSDSDIPLSPNDCKTLIEKLNHDWEVIDNHHLYKKYDFSNFVEALEFVNQVGEYAEEVNHHPNICFTWGEVELKLWTHQIDGLREDDFVWAANVEQLFLDSK